MAVMSTAVVAAAAAMQQQAARYSYQSQRQGIDVLYGLAVSRPGREYLPGWWKFPRTDTTRVDRMNRFVEWKREKIRERNRIRLWRTLAWLCGPPILIATVSLVWRVCAWVVVL